MKLSRITISFGLLVSSVFVVNPGIAVSEDSLDASNIYNKTFTISAYYSPLPCQEKYTTGSYEGDIRLNGNGTNGADGTPVYPGMVAAPKSYGFGTKMSIPGIGIVAVHDRGGAIVASNTEGRYDRLDIWMGYGDIGLQRALNWGKRNVDVVVYGIDDSVIEEVALMGFTPEEAIPNCGEEVFEEDTPQISTEEVIEEVVEEEEPVEFVTNDAEISDVLTFGSSGPEVTALQQELVRLNFLRVEPTGYYGEVTQHAVFKFQQSQGLVSSQDEEWAGVYGPVTREKMQTFIAARSERDKMVAQATERVNGVVLAETSEEDVLLTKELEFGANDEEVVVLQEFLMDQGYFEHPEVTNFYGEVTREAVVRFQLAYNIIDSKDDTGAGRVGPSTRKVINSLS